MNWYYFSEDTSQHLHWSAHNELVTPDPVDPVPLASVSTVTHIHIHAHRYAPTQLKINIYKAKLALIFLS